MNNLLEKMLSDHTGQSIESVRNDIKRDKILTSDGAVEYGLIDEVIRSRKTSQLATSA
jgi:ATP-dependent Clp protease protease subunit